MKRFRKLKTVVRRIDKALTWKGWKIRPIIRRIDEKKDPGYFPRKEKTR